MNKKSIGEIILEARNNKKLSQDALAKKIHVSRQSISNWENNIRVPDKEILEKLCNALNLDYNYLLSVIGEQFQHKKAIKVNRLIIIFIIIIIVIFCMFVVLVKYRNKFEVYSIYFDENSDLYITNGIFIISNVNNYFQLGSLHFYDSNYDIYDFKIKIYYKINDEIRLLIETNYNDNIVLNEQYGYGEYFDDSFDINNVYIDLTSLEDNKIVKTYKLNFSQIFKNDKLLYFKKNNGVINNSPNVNELLITKDQLLNNGYEFEYDTYMKESSNGIFQFDMNENVLYFYNDTLNLKYNLKTDTISGNEYDYENQKLISDFYFNNKTNEFFCYIDSCDNYKDQVKLLTNELNLIIN